MKAKNKLSIFFGALVAVALTACGGPETADLDEPTEQLEVETQQHELRFPTIIMTCDLAEAIYNAVCDEHGNSSSQCTGAYDALHCYCQDCSPQPT